MAGRQVFKRVLPCLRPTLLSPTRLMHVCQTTRQQPQTFVQQRVSTLGLHTTSRFCNANIINIQDEDDFDSKVVKSDRLVIVDFYAHWCGPCKLLGPRLESIVAGKDGKVLMAKVDIDEHADLAIYHGVEAVPTVLAMKGGKMVDKFVGLKDDAALETFVNQLTGE